MAEEDAEIALLHQMQAGQESLAWEDGGENGAADGELPSNTENNNEKVMKEDSVADDQVLRALSPPVAGALSDGGDYDPSSITSHPTVTIAGQEVDSRSSSRASSRKPKTVGGFIADDSDDEEYDGSTPVQITGLTASNTLNRAISPSPLQNSISQHDLQNQADSKIDAHPTVPVNPNVAAGSAPGQSSTQVRTTTAAISSAPPKARLPNDRTGILEDRIKEDPRGDLEAWFSLITEHRNRNKLDDARSVYERFFKILPQAVSLPFALDINYSIYFTQLRTNSTQLSLDPFFCFTPNYSVYSKQLIENAAQLSLCPCFSFTPNYSNIFKQPF